MSYLKHQNGGQQVDVSDFSTSEQPQNSYSNKKPTLRRTKTPIPRRRGERKRFKPDTSCILYNIFTCRFVSLSDNVLGRERDPENTDPNSVSQKWRRNLVTRTCSPRLGRRKERLPRMIPVKISPKIMRQCSKNSITFLVISPVI